MKTQKHSYFKIASVLLSVCLLASSVAAFTPKGQKNYKQGLQYESAQQWEKAAEEFSLAVAADPANSEYQLHYRRAVFNASQAFVQQGATLMEHGDFVGAYNAFRRAYGYDTSNELARSLMERAFRLQTAKDDANKHEPTKPEASARLTPTLYQPGADGPAATHRADAKQDDSLTPARGEELHAIQYSGDLQQFIKYLARQLRLNVVFDRDFPKRNVEVDLQDVTAAQAIDYIFLTQGLFFQKLSNRTILVAEQVKRPQYQQLVLRTFYLYNVDPNDARTLITASIPPQAGRQPVITANKSTNSITVRDTPENVRLIGELLRSIDKERAEVVMDVNIYEVSRDDLMQLGNQIGTGDSLLNLGGIQKGLSVVGGSGQVVTQALSAIPTALGAAFIVPPTALSALQRKDNTRLVASTQVHAFDGEKSTAHIGQRVPVQTATVAPYGAVAGGDSNNNQAGVTQGLFGGNGYPVIQYEKTGLTLEFTPQVFPDLDVQVKMNIKSNDVAQTAGAAALTPTFTERNIEGTARIQNNRTMMIASVAQNSQSRGRQGLPVLGLVPVLGRVVSSPSHNDKQTDIVIAVTPHVMRAPSVTPQDELMHPSGTLQTPTSDTLEAMMQEVNREEMLASARAIPTHANVELPDAVAETTGAKTEQPNTPRGQSAARIEQTSVPVESSAAVVQPNVAVATRAGVGSSAADAANSEAVTFVPAPMQLMGGAVGRQAADGVSVQSTSKPAARDAVLISEADTPQPPAQTDAPKPSTQTEARKSSTPAENSTPSARTEAAKTSAPAETPRQSSGNSLFSFANAEHGRVEVRGATDDAPKGRSSPAERESVGTSPSTANEADAPVSYITEKSSTDMAGAQATSAAAIRLMADSRSMRVGERRQLRLLLKTDAPLGLVALTLRLDPRVLAVRGVGAGTLFDPSDVRVTHTATPEGLVLVTVTPDSASAAVSGAGVLLTFEVEALAPGAEGLRFDADDVHLVATDGRKILLKVMTDEVLVVK